MNLHIDFNPQREARVTAAANRWGVDPATVLEKLIDDYLPPIDQEAVPTISAKNAAAIAYLEQRLKDEASDDPEEIRKADEEAKELLQNLNKNRIDSGESPLC